MPVTQSQIACEAGVSQTIVSDVLHGRMRGRVRPETRERILQVADHLGYRPNAMAQALRSRRSKQIIYMTSDEAREFPALRESDLSGAAQGLRAHGYRLLIEVAATHREEAAILSEMITSGVADGAIVRAYNDRESSWMALRDIEAPIVVIGQCSDERITSVAHDVPTIIASAVQRLSARGHRRIGLIVAPTHDTYHQLVIDLWAKLAHSADLSPKRWFAESSGRAHARAVVNNWLSESEHPTSIISLDPPLALGATMAITEHGGRLGGDYDLVVIAEKSTAWLYESGTQLYGFDMEGVGGRAANELLTLLGGGPGGGRIRMLPELIEV